MTLPYAYDLMDLLLDKVDQAYFTNNEKNIFIDLATFEYINKYYKVYGINQDSRDKLKHFTKMLQYANGIYGMAPRATWSLPSPLQDYMHLVSVTVNHKKAKILSHEDFTARAGNSLFNMGVDATKNPFIKPDHDNPIVTIGWPFSGDQYSSVSWLQNNDAESSNNAFVWYYPGNWTAGGEQAIQQATAVAVLDPTQTFVTNIDMIQFGSGYASTMPPSVSISNPSNHTGVSVTLGAPVIDNEAVVSIPVLSPGSGYNEIPPTIMIDPPNPNMPNDILNIHYIRTPKQGRGSLEFNEIPHDAAMEIIKIATRMMTASIESSNYEVVDKEVNKGV